VRTGHTIRVFEGLLHGASVCAPDLRGGAALLVAALMAEGESEIRGDTCIARGYEDIERKLFMLGARIRVKEPASATAPLVTSARETCASECTADERKCEKKNTSEQSLDERRTRIEEASEKE